jgi:hypothetical protein
MLFSADSPILVCGALWHGRDSPDEHPHDSLDPVYPVILSKSFSRAKNH